VTASLVTRILEFNCDREPERLALKYAAMRRDPFSFFRGTAHLFHDDWPKRSPLDRTALTWACGDLHLENFGSYEGGNRLAYFDINDFDEAALAPCARDLARFLTSVLLAAAAIRVRASDARELCRETLRAYGSALRLGKPGWVERDTARGMVRSLLKRVRSRTRAELLAERTVFRQGRRRIRTDGRHANPATRDMRHAVTTALQAFGARQSDPRYYKVVDVARRIAGTGSLGLERFVVLVRGSGVADGHVLLDVKQAAPSALIPSLRTPQPTWRNEADRVVTIQQRVQAVSPALLHVLRVGGDWCILRELQPMEDRLSLAGAHRKLPRLRRALETMAQVIAWGQLRCAGRGGSAIGDEWVAFGHDRQWPRGVLDYAVRYVRTVRHDWKEFAVAYDDHVFDADPSAREPRASARS